MSIEKRYQVFVSSTYTDLQEERQEVIKALLELDCFPASMEFFSATDDDQWSLIERTIDSCDYYIVVIAGRYGTLSSEGISYTEKEYRYALKKNIPIIGFLYRDADSLPNKKTEVDRESIEKLEAFRELVQKKMCKYWSSASELGSVVSRSLVNLQRTHPAIGWVRGNLVPDKDSSSEILELKREIEKLKQELEETKTEAPKGSENLSQGDDEIVLNYTCKTFYPSSSYIDTWKDSINTTWNEIFSKIAPYLMNDISETGIKHSLNSFIKKLAIKENNLSEFLIDADDFQTIKIQFRALGLIEQSSVMKSTVTTFKTYWKLTPYGETIMNQLRAIKR